MDRAISASDANRQFSGILRDVKRGDSFVVVSRGTPVARIVPVEHDDAKRLAAREALREHWRQLDKEPMVLVEPWTRDELYDRDDEDRPWLKR